MANRIWQHHFGRGIVATPNDFGTHGDPPTHPELLEYLANEFAHPAAGSEDAAWRIKRLHKLIILSSTYQEAAAHLANEADPEDRLLAHWHTHRLEAEAIRDSILAASGKLNLAVGGPSVYPPLSQKVVGDSAGLDWGNSDERQASRRSVYVFVKRSIALPELEVMGLADSAGSCDQRAVATTALQSLMLLNSKFVWQQAEAFSQRVQKEAGEKPEDRVRAAFIIALCREPRLEEFEHSLQFLKTRESERTPGGPSSLAQLCLVLLNTNEFVYSN
ncbi:MAG: hypothetical protein JWM97_529, partial [Phycisphaerales bacterium]|nr:hypothetical protein [Phycisphaerales bacterium]